ncbi:HAD family hydrolase [Celerinatantimonas sp. YJH-8]|uniref:HAD family hydrolase n=1 Tax=Celerinatantimonas sp. YJH-8 TaxID=3228714 RepID=UPI0038C649E5
MPTNSLTIFDLDDTLLNGDTMALWHRYIVKQQLVDHSDQFLAQDREYEAAYRNGTLDMQAYLNFSLEPLQSYAAEQVDQMVQEFIQQTITPLLYPQAFKLMAELRQKHHQLLVISATVDFIVRPVAKLFDIQDVLAINVARQHGRYTPQIIGTPSFREGKIIRLQQWLTQQSEQPEDLHFYSDSINDLPLLEQVDHPYVVNPCQPLADIANKRGWPVLEWQLGNAE